VSIFVLRNLFIGQLIIPGTEVKKPFRFEKMNCKLRKGLNVTRVEGHIHIRPIGPKGDDAVGPFFKILIGFGQGFSTLTPGLSNSKT